MTSFKPIPLVKLYNIAKKAKYDGYGNLNVYIDERKKYKVELAQYYQEICMVFNGGQKMTWLHLYNFLNSKLKETIIILD